MSTRAVILTLLFFALAFFLEHLPMPEIILWFQPPWVLLMVTLLVLYAPHWFGVWLALPLGLLLDIEHHQLMGYHVLTLTVHIYVLQLLYSKLKRFNNPLLVIVVIALVVVHQLVGAAALWLIGNPAPVTLWQPVVSAALAWLWLHGLFNLTTENLRLR